jgi:hypothetical protein
MQGESIMKQIGFESEYFIAKVGGMEFLSIELIE